MVRLSGEGQSSSVAGCCKWELICAGIRKSSALRARLVKGSPIFSSSSKSSGVESFISSVRVGIFIKRTNLSFHEILRNTNASGGFIPRVETHVASKKATRLGEQVESRALISSSRPRPTKSSKSLISKSYRILIIGDKS